MSLPALQSSAGAQPTAPSHPHDAAAKSSDGEAFSAIVSAFAGEPAHASAPGSSSKNAPEETNKQSPQDDASKSPKSQSLDSDLAGLVQGALPTNGEFGQPASNSAGSKKRAPSDADAAQAALGSALASGILPGSPIWRAQADLAASAIPGATPRPASASIASVSGSGAASSLAALASAAAKPAAPIFANAGALETLQEAATPVSFTVEQSRTHLGVDGAAQTLAKDPILRAQASASLTSAGTAGVARTQFGSAATAPSGAAPTASPVAAVGAAAAAALAAAGAASAGSPAASPPSPRAKASPDSLAGASRSAAQTDATALAGQADGAASRVSTSSSTQNETGSQKRSARDNPGKAASGAPQATAPSASANPAASVLASAMVGGGVSTTISLGPVSLGRLAETLASQATGLVSQAAASASARAGSASVAGSQPVKELEIRLDPADLGAMSVKMRLSDGKLSVVMEVSKPSTLKAVESDRDSIAQRLGLSVQSLESLIIKPSAANAQTGAAASGQKPEGRENAQSDARNSGDSQGRQDASRRDGSADQGSRQQPSYQPVAGRGFGDMVV
ncbi:MAG TPA: flagellar hook-length control protein FliK [Roseiarcus sp.]